MPTKPTVTVPRLRRALRQNFQGEVGRPIQTDAPADPPAPISYPSVELKDMNFKVDPNFHQEFKIEATKRGMKMNEFLRHIYQSFMQRESAR
jgi:hypothetical protein